jgi:hypothetical protein
MGFEAIARGPIGVAGEGVVVEEPEPVVDAVPGRRLHGDVGDLRQSFCAPCEPLRRLGVVAGVVPHRFFRVCPGVAFLPVGHEGVGDGIGVVRLDQRMTPETLDLHGVLLFSPTVVTGAHQE